MGRKKSKASKATQQKVIPQQTSTHGTERQASATSSHTRAPDPVLLNISSFGYILCDPVQSHQQQPGPSRRYDQPSTSAKLESPQKSDEERKREAIQKFHDVLASSLKHLNFEAENKIPTEILMLVFAKGRWQGCPRSKVLLLDWIQSYNKYGRIDGPGFKFMRRDNRILMTGLLEDAENFTMKFPYRTDLPKGYQQKKSKTKTDEKSGQQTSRKKDTETTGKAADVKKDESMDYFSEDEEDNLSFSSRLSTLFEPKYVMEAVAAHIAFELICVPRGGHLLHRLFLFEKHQLITEWEIAKEAYRVRNIDWRLAPGMIRLCNEVAMEMIEIDKAIDAIRCLGRHELAEKLFKILKKCIKAREQRKYRIREMMECSAREEPQPENIKGEEGYVVRHSIPSTETEESESEDEIIEENEYNGSEADVEELDRSIVSDEAKDELVRVKQYLAQTFIDLLRVTRFFDKIRRVERSDDPRGHLNYIHYRKLCSMYLR